MGGAASPPAPDEEEPSGASVDLESRPPAAATMIVPEVDKDKKGRGYVDSLLTVSLHLLRNSFVPEVRVKGLNLMLHLWKFRWDELHVDEWSTTSDDSNLVSYHTTGILPSKSAIAAVLAEVIMSAGSSLWNDLLPAITFLSKRGSTEAQLLSSVLERIPDFNTACTVGLEASLSGQHEVPSDVMPVLPSGNVGMLSHHQEKGQLLLMEHNLLSEAFVTVTSFPRTQNTEALLTNLLNTLNNIWTHPDWEDKYMRYKYCLFDLLADDQFTLSVNALVKSFEKDLGIRIAKSAGSQGRCSSAFAPYLDSCTLPKLMLHLILQILDCIQMRWKEPITYHLSGVVAENISCLLENGKLPNIDEAILLKNAGTWLKGIRETGYNIIGLCASLDGAFGGLLDCSCIISVLMKNLRSMEFNHLGKIIQLVFIPLVKHCPQKCWDKWMLKLLEPVFSYCEDIFCNAWFTFLHEGRAKVPYYFGDLDGPAEIVIQFEKETLLKFTRSVSDLLGVLASKSRDSGPSLPPLCPKNCIKADFQDLKPVSCCSLIGYLLQHNCFGKLSIYLFGCFADYRAAEKAVPFCYHLIDLAVAINHVWLNQFFREEMLPTIILLLDDFPCALSKLSSSLNSTTKDLGSDVANLCQRIYEVYIYDQVTVGEGEVTKALPVLFKEWLAKKLNDLHIRANCATPEHFPKDIEWKWEFNEEFERYLPAYMHMLKEVEEMDDCLKDNLLDTQILLKKLKPEFKSRYAINSSVDPCLRTMTCMLQRKMPSVFYRKRTEWITQLLMQLISLKPYIKLTDSEENVLDRLEEICEPQFEIYQCNPAWAVDIFRHSILFYWEPQFHPLIREGHMELLKTLAHELAFAEGSKPFEPLEPHVDDFLEHLRPYAYMHVKRKKEEYGYFKAEEQVRWHEVFDKYLASGALDHRMNEFSCLKDGFVHTIVADFKGCPFEKLDHDLIRMSFERRARIVEWECQMSCYFECLASLLDNDEMKQKLGSLMSLLSTEGFFRVDDDSIDWDNKSFSESIDEFNEVVFSGKCVDRCLLIRGIMDYQKIMQMKNVDWKDAFRMVVRDAKYLWKGYLEEFWLETRSYTHEYYEIVSKPLQKVYLREDEN